MDTPQLNRAGEVGSGGWMDGWWVRGEMEAERREGEVLMNGLMAHWPTNVAAALPVAPPGLVKHTYSQWCMHIHIQINRLLWLDLILLYATPRVFLKNFLHKDFNLESLVRHVHFHCYTSLTCAAEFSTETTRWHTSANISDCLLLKVMKWRKRCWARTGKVRQLLPHLPPLSI